MSYHRCYEDFEASWRSETQSDATVSTWWAVRCAWRIKGYCKYGWILCWDVGAVQMTSLEWWWGGKEVLIGAVDEKHKAMCAISTYNTNCRQTYARSRRMKTCLATLVCLDHALQLLTRAVRGHGIIGTRYGDGWWH